jgi:hypothetical protein
VCVTYDFDVQSVENSFLIKRMVMEQLMYSEIGYLEDMKGTSSFVLVPVALRSSFTFWLDPAFLYRDFVQFMVLQATR